MIASASNRYRWRSRRTDTVALIGGFETLLSGVPRVGQEGFPPTGLGSLGAMVSAHYGSGSRFMR